MPALRRSAARSGLIGKVTRPHPKFKVLAGAASLAIALPLAACGTSAPAAQSGSSSSQSPQAMSQSSAAPQAGTFEGLNDKHVAGTVEVAEGQVVLSGFSSDAGPDLHVYLTHGSDESAVAAGKELGKVASDQASQTFSIAGIDASKYDTVVIHCDKAKAVFGAATLS